MLPIGQRPNCGRRVKNGSVARDGSPKDRSSTWVAHCRQERLLDGLVKGDASCNSRHRGGQDRCDRTADAKHRKNTKLMLATSILHGPARAEADAQIV